MELEYIIADRKNRKAQTYNKRFASIPAGRKKLQLHLSIVFSFGLTVFQMPAQQQAMIVACNTNATTNNHTSSIDIKLLHVGTNKRRRSES